MHDNLEIKIPNTTEVKTTNYLFTMMGSMVLCILISPLFRDLEFFMVLITVVLLFLLMNFLNKGVLQIETHVDFLKFTWKKKPLFRFCKKGFLIYKKDLLYVSYIDGYRTDRLKIIGKNKFLTVEISLQNTNDLKSELVHPLKVYLNTQNSTINLQEEKRKSSYYRKTNLFRIIAFYGAGVFLVLFFCSLILHFLFNEIFHIRLIGLLFLGFLFLFIIYGFARFYLKKYLNEQEYEWLKI